MAVRSKDSFQTRRTLEVDGSRYTIYSLERLEAVRRGVDRLPYSLKILLENLLRNEDGRPSTPKTSTRSPTGTRRRTPSARSRSRRRACCCRTSPACRRVVDLAAMRDAMAAMGGDPQEDQPAAARRARHRPLGAGRRLRHAPTRSRMNAELEFERNRERYAFLRWGQTAFDNFSVVPPDTGIVHQVNLEYLARVVFVRQRDGATRYPDTLVGTDSHTTMINGLGVLGWGVGGIEAEAAMLGQPSSMLIPQVVGFKLTGKLPRGRDRDRPRADRHADAAQAGRRRQVRRVLRHGSREPPARRPRDDRATWRRSTARRAASSRSTTRRSRTCASPAAARAQSRSSRPTRRRRASSARRRRPSPRTPTRSSSISATVEPSVAGPRAPAGPRAASRNRSTSWRQRAGRTLMRDREVEGARQPTLAGASASASTETTSSSAARRGRRSPRSRAARTRRTRR